MVVSPEKLQETTSQFLTDRPLILVSGVLAMTAGLAIVNSHNVWTFGWPVIVTLFGWALAVGGAVRIAAPVFVSDVGGSMMNRPGLTRAIGVGWGLLGAFLSLKGYA